MTIRKDDVIKNASPPILLEQANRGFRIILARVAALEAATPSEGSSVLDLNGLLTAGSSTVYTAASTLTAYPARRGFDVEFHTNCGASPTLNVNGLGARKLYRADGTTQLSAADVVAGPSYRFIYDATLDGATGGFKAAATV